MRFLLTVAIATAFTSVSLAQTESVEKELREKLATIGYMQKLQQPDGGFIAKAIIDPKVATKSGLRPTLSGLRTLKYLGAPIKDTAKITEFVRSCFDPETGGFADAPGGKPDVTLTSVGIMAMVELDLKKDPSVARAVEYLAKNSKSFEEYRIAAAGFEASDILPDAAKSWIEATEKKSRLADGTFGQGDDKPRSTGGAIAMLLRLGAKISPEDQKAVIATLHAGQQADGAFRKTDAKGSDLETTYRVMRCFFMLKNQPRNVEKLRAFIESCRNSDGGYGVSPGEASTASATYYATIIKKWLAR